MKVLILDGSDEERGLSSSFSAGLSARTQEDMEITHITLNEKRISPCRGCFGCWIRTPGECVIDDFGRELNRLFVSNDVVVFIGPVFHGCHSTAVKRVFDRSIPFLQPFFRKVEGKVHHRMRYDTSPDMIFIGMMDHRDEGQEAIFRELTKRNAVNFGVKDHEVLFHHRDDDPMVLVENTCAFIRRLSP